MMTHARDGGRCSAEDFSEEEISVFADDFRIFFERITTVARRPGRYYGGASGKNGRMREERNDALPEEITRNGPAVAVAFICLCRGGPVRFLFKSPPRE